MPQNHARPARRLARVEKAVAGMSSAPQLAHSSIEDGAVDEYDAAGNLVSSIGKQFDGTHMAVSLSGPVPPAPSAPSVVGGAGSLTVGFDGTFVGGLTVPAPLDYSRCEVHVAPVAVFDALSAEYLVGSIESPRGGTLTIAPAAGTWYVALVVRSLSGKTSPRSEIVSAVVTAPADAQAIGDALAQFDLDMAEMESSFTVLDTNLTDARERLGEAETELYETFPQQVTQDISTAKQQALTEAANTAQGKVDAAKTALQASIDAAVASGQSIIGNGNFEQGNTGWNTGAYQYTRDSATARSGGKVMFLTPDAGNVYPVSGYVPSGKLKTFYMEAYFRRVAGAEATKQVGFVAQSNTAANGFSTPVTGQVNASTLSATAWTKVSATYTIPDTVDAVRTRFAPWAQQSTNDYEVDDFVVVDVTAATDALTAAKADATTKANNALEAAKTDATNKDAQVKIDAAQDAQNRADVVRVIADKALAQAQDLVINGGFEVDSLDKAFTGTISNTLSLVADGTAKQGSKFVRHTHNTAFSTASYLNNIAVLPGHTYRVSMYARLTSGTVTGSIGWPMNWLRANGSTYNSGWPALFFWDDFGSKLVTGQWVQLHDDITVPEGENLTTLVTRFYAYDNACSNGAQIDFDAVSVQDITAARQALDDAAAAQDRANEAHALAGTAEGNAQLAITSANGKNAILRSLSVPSGEGKVIGDVWWQYADATWKRVIGQWAWNGTGPDGGWIQQQLSHETIASVDIGTLTVIGQSTLADVVAMEMSVQIAKVIELDVERLTVTDTTVLDDTVANSIVTKYFATRKLNANLVVIGESGNYIVNGNGEKGDNSGWAAPLTRETADKPATVQAAFKCAAGQGTQQGGGDPFTVEPNTEYVVEYWLKADKPNSKFYMELRDQAGNLVGGTALDSSLPWVGSSIYIVSNHTMPTTWTRYRGVIRTGGSVLTLRVAAMYFNHPNGTERTAVQSVAGLSLKPRLDGTLIADTIYGKTLIGPTIKTATSGARWEIDALEGIRGFSANGGVFFDSDESGVKLSGEITKDGQGVGGKPLRYVLGTYADGGLANRLGLTFHDPADPINTAFEQPAQFVSYDGTDATMNSRNKGEGRRAQVSVNYDPVTLNGIASMNATMGHIVLDATQGKMDLIADFLYLNGMNLTQAPSSVSFLNGYSNFGGGYAALRSKQVMPGVVTLTGMPKPGSNPGTATEALIGVVTGQHRPATTQLMDCILRCGANPTYRPGMVTVNSLGEVRIFGGLADLTYAGISVTYFLN